MPSRVDIPFSRLVGLAILSAIVIAALFFAQQVLVPFALAVLFAFLLTPIVRWLEHLRLPRILAVIFAVAVCLSLITATGWIVANQFLTVANQLPAYRTNIRNKIQSLRQTKQAALGNATATVQEVGKELFSTHDEPAGNAGSRKTALTPPVAPRREVPVTVEPLSGALDSVRDFLGPTVAPLVTFLLVTVFTVLMLVKREDLRNRLLRLAGQNRLNATTQALDEAARRVSRYLQLQFLVNTSFGAVFATGLHFIGVPQALLWGVLAGLLRFIPYIGAFIAAAMPTALALAAFPGWTRAVLTLLLFGLLELVIANFVEPFLYGAHTGISAIAILVSAVFWTLLWGPIGLILATPLTACLLVMGRFIPQLAFLNVILGDEEVLPVEALFYQRLLSWDREEAEQLADAYLKENSLLQFYDSVLIPSLRMAEIDRHQGTLDGGKEQFIVQNTREMIEEWGDREAQHSDNVQNPRLTALKIVCLPASDDADETTAAMLSQLLRVLGVDAAQMSSVALIGEMVQEISGQEASIVCVCALAPFAVAKARSVCKRLRAALPQLKIVVGIWGSVELTGGTESRVKSAGADHIVFTLEGAVETVRQLVEAASYREGAGKDPALPQLRP